MNTDSKLLVSAIFLAVIICVATISVTSESSDAETLTPESGADIGTLIKENINDSLTIELQANGEYTLTNPGGFLGDSLTISGNGAKVTISDLVEVNTNNNSYRTLSVTGVNFLGEMTGTTNPELSFSHFQDVSFNGCTSSGMMLTISSKDIAGTKVDITNCDFTPADGNTMESNYPLTIKAHHIAATDCDVTGFARGINIWMGQLGPSTVSVSGCDVVDATAKCGLQISYGTTDSRILVSGCTFSNCLSGISLHDTSVEKATVVSVGNTFLGCTSDVMYCNGSVLDVLSCSDTFLNGDGVEREPLVSGEDGIDVPDGTLAAADWYVSEGIITLDSVDDLRQFATMVNAGESFEGRTIELTQSEYDISDTAWTPIGNSPRGDLTDTAAYFSGTFIGNDSTIVGLNDSGYAPEASSINKDNEYLFGFFGYVHDATITGLRFTDVSVNGTYEEYLSDSFGALIGYATGAVTISNIQVSGSINAYDAVAGIVGRGYAVELTITDCINNAKIVSTRDNGKAGGIIGTVSTPCLDFDAINCVNNGDVTCETGNVGGIVGFLGNVADANYAITDGSNSGNINGNYAGGAIGYDGTSEKTVTVGGDLGFSNSGQIIATSGAGGIVGIWQSDGSITAATNSGAISGEGTAGGIVASVNYNSLTVSSSSVIGSETITGPYAGGIVASAGGESLTIIDCSVAETVTLKGTDDRVTDNSGTIFYGTVEGVAVGKIREADLIIRGMSDYGEYELVSTTYSNGNDTITLEDCTTSNIMTWTSNSSSFTLILVNTQLAGLEFNRTVLNISSDGQSVIGKLIAGVEVMASVLDDKGISGDFSGKIVIASDTTLNVNEFKAVPITTGHTWTSNSPAITGADNSAGLTVTDGETVTHYLWNGTEWSSDGVVTVTFDLWNSETVINMSTGSKISKYPESDRVGFTIDGWKNGNDVWADESTVTESITLTPVWKFEEEEVTITSDSGKTELCLESVVPEYEGTITSYSWSGPDGISDDQESITVDTPGTYTLNVTFTSENDDSLKKTLTATVTIYSVTFDDSVRQTVLLVPSGGSIADEQIPSISEREGYFSLGWDTFSFENITSDTTVNAVWMPMFSISVSFSGTLGHDLTATVTADYQPAEGVSLWYQMYESKDTDNQTPIETNLFSIDEGGVYTFYVYAIDDSDTPVAFGFSEQYDIRAGQAPEEVFEIDREGDNGTVQSSGDVITIASDGNYADIEITIGFPVGTMTLSGSVAPQNYSIVLKPLPTTGTDYDYGFQVETPILSVSSITLTLNVSVPDGYTISDAMVYREDNGQIVGQYNATYANGKLTFTTSGNSSYWVDATFVEIDDESLTPSHPGTNDDDEESIPPVIRPSGSSSSENDNTVTVVACAAAAAVAAIMAVFLIVLYKKD